MTLHPRFPRPVRATVALGAVALLSITPLQAQQAAPNPPTATEAEAAPKPAESFAFEIGHAANTGAVYSVYATQPATSKLTGQRVRLKIVTTSGFDRNTHYFTLATGKHKTVAQLNAFLVEVFQHFLAATPPAPGQELGKIGDVKQGGEVRFVVASAKILRFDNLSPDQPVQVSNYSRDEVAGLLAALTGTPST